MGGSIYDWDPKYDPIYDPETRLCHFESDPRNRFTTKRYLLPMGGTRKLSSMPVSNLDASQEQNESLSRPQRARVSTSSFDRLEDITSPENQASSTESSIKSRSSSDFSDSSCLASEDVLYVPDKCKDFERKWDFIVGNLLSANPKIIGWVSRIGFADNFIREMGFSMRSATYTLIPHILSKKASSIKELISDCNFVEIKCKCEDLFHNLYIISSKIDSHFIKIVVAIDITFDKCGMASIKVVMKKSNSDRIYRELSKVHSRIII